MVCWVQSVLCMCFFTRTNSYWHRRLFVFFKKAKADPGLSTAMKCNSLLSALQQFDLFSLCCFWNFVTRRCWKPAVYVSSWNADRSTASRSGSGMKPYCQTTRRSYWRFINHLRQKSLFLVVSTIWWCRSRERSVNCCAAWRHRFLQLELWRAAGGPENLRSVNSDPLRWTCSLQRR